MIDRTIFGEFDGTPNRKIVHDVKKCASTGLKIENGDALIPIHGSNFFFRVKSQVYKRKDIRDDIIDLFWVQHKAEQKVLVANNT